MSSSPSHERSDSDHGSSNRRIDRHDKTVRAIFDDWARSGQADGMERRHKRLAARMLERIEIPPDARLLDIGCGYGWIAKMLSTRVPDGAIVGIDPSHEMIWKARSACDGLANTLFAPASAEEIPWAEDYFTQILSIESAYYWTDVPSALREIYRVTSYGGAVHILINYYEGNPFSEGWDREMGVPLTRLSADEWVELFSKASFQDVSAERIPDDSPIPAGKPPDELERRVGLQRIGALHVSGRKPSLPDSPPRHAPTTPDPFRILR